MYQIKTTPTFENDLRKLDRQIAKRIIQKIEWLAGQARISDLSVKYLPKDLEGLQKYRIGDWRVLFWLDHKKKEIILYGVEHRKSIYRRF